jgi:hypothetical protein
MKRFGWDDTRCFKAMKDVEIEDDAFKHRGYYHSMTPSERSKPSLDVKRKARISKVQEQKLSKSIN